MNEYEKSFNEEVRTKKQAANGVHGKTGKRGLVGSVKTPADLLTGKERKAYEGTSPVTTSSIYDTIMPFAEFKALGRHKKMIALFEYRKRFSARELSKAWDVSDTTIYYYLRAYALTQQPENKTTSACPQETDTGSDGTASDATAAASSISATDAPASETVTDTKLGARPGNEKAPATSQASKAQPPTSECRFMMAGTYDGGALIRKLDGLSAMTAGGQQYQVEIRISELSRNTCR